MTDFNRRKFLATSGVMAAALLVNFGPAAWAHRCPLAHDVQLLAY
jgi:hypothetical protein